MTGRLHIILLADRVLEEAWKWNWLRVWWVGAALNSGANAWKGEGGLEQIDFLYRSRTKYAALNMYCNNLNRCVAIEVCGVLCLLKEWHSVSCTDSRICISLWDCSPACFLLRTDDRQVNWSFDTRAAVLRRFKVATALTNITTCFRTNLITIIYLFMKSVVDAPDQLLFRF